MSEFLAEELLGGGTKQFRMETVKTSTLINTLHSNSQATGNGTSMNVDGYGVVTFQITGTFVATVVFEGSVDGTNYVGINGRDRNTGSSVSQVITQGIFEIDCRGLQFVRARISARTSGGVTVVGRAEPFAGSPSKMDVQLTGSNLEYYGATVAERPAANTVRVGAIYMAVNTGELWQSNGASWVVL